MFKAHFVNKFFEKIGPNDKKQTENLNLKSHLFVLEGPDGVGKTTLASHLNRALRHEGISCKLFSFPGQESGTIGKHIYQLYHQPERFRIKNISAVAEQLLFTAAHLDVIQTRILPALASFRVVILDRFWWSTWVYSTVRKLDPKIRDLLIKIELSVWQDIKPSAVFLIHRGKKGASRNQKDLIKLYRCLGTRQKRYVSVINVDNRNEIGIAVNNVYQEISKRCRA